jgi:GT2 family glycosyltransferase
VQACDVSIIVVNWNTKDLVRDCLASVYRQTKHITFEVIVVDNGSHDGSGEMIKTEFPQAILIENPDNKGFAAANNQAMAVATGRYLLLLNSDTVVLNNAIHKTVSFADAHPEAAVVGCRILNPDREVQPTCFMFPSLLNTLLSSTYLYKLFPKSKFFGREHMTWWSRDCVREVEVVTGCFMLVRRKAIEQVGVMDERFFVYGEETDWCYRFRKAGWKVLFTPHAEIIHLCGASTRQVKSEMILQLHKSKLLLFRKHRNFLVYAATCLLVATFFIVRIPYWLSRAICTRSDRAKHLQTARTYIVGVFRVLTGG